MGTLPFSGPLDTKERIATQRYCYFPRRTHNGTVVFCDYVYELNDWHTGFRPHYLTTKEFILGRLEGLYQ